jgi:hypothetical protein
LTGIETEVFDAMLSSLGVPTGIEQGTKAEVIADAQP